MGGADRIPPGPKGRGPFSEEDKFKLPDGRVYVPGDAATDSIYGRLFCRKSCLYQADLALYLSFVLVAGKNRVQI
jgi:hypothetical protein